MLSFTKIRVSEVPYLGHSLSVSAHIAMVGVPGSEGIDLVFVRLRFVAAVETDPLGEWFSHWWHLC